MILAFRLGLLDERLILTSIGYLYFYTSPHSPLHQIMQTEVILVGIQIPSDGLERIKSTTTISQYSFQRKVGETSDTRAMSIRKIEKILIQKQALEIFETGRNTCYNIY